MAMYLTNGTLNYNLTKKYILTPEQIAERNNMIPDYPDPNDERFKETLPVFTIQDDQLCRDGVAIGKIYNNKTGKVVEITETTETGFKYRDTEENALINKDNSIAVVEKLTGLKGEVVKETRLVIYYDIQDISNQTSICTNYGNDVKSIEVDGVLLDSVVTTYQFNSVGEHVIKYEFNNPTALGNGAPVFYNITTIKRVIIADTFTSIGGSAFQSCWGLTSVTIPDSVTSIGESAFSNCSSLTSIVIPNGVTSINANTFYQCSSLTSVTIPDSVTSISVSAFGNCSGLTNVTIGNGVTGIGASAFQSCSSLTSITIPDSVIGIYASAFQGCSNLTSIIIGKGVTTISNYAFAYCSNLVNITSLITTAPSITDSVFYGIKTDGTLTVPAGATGYDTWMGTGNYYLGYYNWTKVEQS